MRTAQGDRAMSRRLEGKVALITGGAGGIGRAICETFRREGAIVIAGDLAEPSDLDPGIAFRTLDVTVERQWRETIEGIVAEHGGLDILVNNAGTVVSYERMHQVSMTDYDKVVAVIQTGTFIGMRTAIPVMIARGGGAIVNISSTLGIVAADGAAAYQIAKSAIRGLTKNAAVSYARRNIRVNSVHPGLVATPMTANQGAVNDWTLSMTPMRRIAEPHEIAAACLFLSSDEASYVTGVELPVDGGYLAQ
jgi:NAD(P)-dependent dehydrogenase (short-subunit alcohol dehydrogenase family)